jgi:hypothetical protein
MTKDAGGTVSVDAHAPVGTERLHNAVFGGSS